MLHLVRGAGHGFSSPDVDSIVDQFLDEHLKTQPKTPISEWNDPNHSAPPGSIRRTFFSKTAKAEVSYVVYLPPDYWSSAKRFPVIYWLHGLSGNQRGGARSALPHFDAAFRAGAAPPAILVMVNGLWNSMYCDSSDGKWPVESVIVRDLVPHIDATYRTIANRNGRAVEGFSMGGFGAAHLAFKYPDLFGAASIMAGALVDSDDVSKRHSDLLAKMFGGDKAKFDAERPQVLVTKNGAAVKNGTQLRIVIGADDQLLHFNRDFSVQLTNLGIKHDFEIIPGVGHNQGLFYQKLGPRTATWYGKVFSGGQR
jgi:endo-1,4-beta-xylanase